MSILASIYLDSAKSLKQNDPNASSGIYFMDPHDQISGKDPILVYCLINTNTSYPAGRFTESRGWLRSQMNRKIERPSSKWFTVSAGS